MKVKDIARLAIICALYVALTYAFSFMAYGDIQFRIAEILVLLCFFRKDYIISLTLGCLIANLLSPMGLYDVIFGTIATILSCLCICFLKNIFLCIAPPVIFNGVIVGLELHYILDLPFVPSMISVAIGEAAVLVVGAIIFFFLKKNKMFMKMIFANQNVDLEDETESQIDE